MGMFSPSIIGFCIAEAFFYAYNRSMNSIQNEITATFFGEVDDIGQATAFFSELLAQSEGEELELLINSPGGAVFEGINIASLLQRRSGSTTTTALNGW
jgi:ATP-dependent protease ClpP protease subunit